MTSSLLSSLAWLAPLLLRPPQQEPKPAPAPVPSSSSPATPQEGEAPRLHRLAFEWGPRPPTLVEIESSLASELSIAMPGAPPPKASKSSMSRRFVDEVVVEGERTKVSRYFARCQFEEDGKVNDPPYVGESFDLWSDGETVDVRNRARRHFSTETFHRQQLQLQAPALWLPLLEELAVGGEFECEPIAFLQLLLELEGTIESGHAKLKLEAVDEAKGVATLRGTAKAVEKLTRPVEATVEWECELEVALDLAARRVAAVECRGTLRGSGRVMGIEAKVTGTFRHAAKVVDGPPAVAALAEKPKLRLRNAEVGVGKVSMTLPSCFEEIQAEPESLWQFSDDDGQMSFALQAFPHDSAKPADAIAATIEAIRKSVGSDPKVREVKSPLGSGKAITFEAEANTIDVELYPIGKDHVLRLRFIGSPAMRKRFEKDIARVRATLKALP